MILVCTSVLLLFIPLAKWYKKQRFKAQHSTYPTIYWEFSRNYKSTISKKSSLDGYLKLTIDISLKSLA